MYADMMIVDFISHSASVLQLQFLYQVALADKAKDKVIVDVGSRLGAVLYAVKYRNLDRQPLNLY